VTALALVLLATTFLYGRVAAGMVVQWLDDTSTSYGILLLGAACVVARRAAPSLRTLPLRPHNLGFAAIACAMLVFIGGTLAGEVFLLRASLPLLIAGAILALWGVAYLRALLPAVALLALAIPLPAVVVTDLTLPLQLVASRVATATLLATGIPVVRDGNLLRLPNITLEVAEACSGMSSVVALVAVAATCAALAPLRAGRAALLIISAVPIGVMGNGLRVAASGVLAYWFGEPAVEGLVHEMTGFVAFVAMCGVSFALLALTRRGELRWARQHP
jgi:exosortase